METVTLSIKGVPRRTADRIKERAARHHRSLQGELMAILEEAATSFSIDDLAKLSQRMGLRTKSDAARVIRRDRDARRR